ncbi:MAG: phosphate ABC transporter ATP-binding protein [Saprospiraceae bacterium]|nr:phosphate ABC transporter ATP-binding protein [Saprospiraceae bacterium]
MSQNESSISFDFTDRAKKVKLEAIGAHVYYDDNHVLKDINMIVRENTITALIGPSGCGKSTFLRLFNRMNDYIDSFQLSGQVLIDSQDIYERNVNVENLRKNVGMVFQKPNPFPKSIFENVAFGMRIRGISKKTELEGIVEDALKNAVLWDEVKDRLQKPALSLSGGQQQRLCIARVLAVKPTVLLMDEPASALDPIATAKIEELINVLKEQYTILIVTHNMQQASRISDKTAFFYQGQLIEYEATRDIFINPRKDLTERYITGRFG